VKIYIADSRRWRNLFSGGINFFGAVYSSPAIAKDEIIISSTDGTVYCLKRKL